MKRLDASIKKITADPKKRGMDIYTKWPNTPNSTDLVFRVGSNMFTKDMNNLAIPAATRGTVIQLPGSGSVAKY
jgi:hypothetical protein